MNNIIKATTKTLMDRDVFLSIISNYFEEEDNAIMKNIYEQRLNKLENKIEDLRLFCSKLQVLVNDETKFIHMRNFLKFYFYKSDPALIDTNIKIIIDYILDKNSYEIYDLLLEKMCLLNKYSIEVLKDIKELETNSDGYYTWEDYLKYNQIDRKKTFANLLCADSDDDFYTKAAFGFKALMDGEFICNYPLAYPGNIDVSAVDYFMLTNLGHKLIKYI